MTTPLSIGFSPCPNDTFIFYALVHQQVPLAQATLLPPHLEDVESLNRLALQGKLDVSKLSFHALGHVLDKYVMLNSGAALGRGCGPLLIARPEQKSSLTRSRIAIPGELTTAAMLLRLYAPEADDFVIMRFDEIMAAVKNKQVDYGVIIHESRFTYPDYGLESIEDLGLWWEELTGLPIPLGCIAARRTLAPEVIRDIDRAVKESLQWARVNPAACMGYIREHAQEMKEKVLQNHIGLYVNDFSLDMGEDGRAAVEELLRRGREARIFSVSPDTPWLFPDA